jgi:hypothetical protein
VIHLSSLLESVLLKVSDSLTFWILVVEECEAAIKSPKPKTALISHSSLSLLVVTTGSEEIAVGFLAVPAGASESAGCLSV